MPFVAAGRVTPNNVAQARITHYLSLGTVPKYDLGRGYQLCSPNALIIDDLRRTWWLRSRIHRAHYPAWIALAANAPWGALPVNAELAAPGSANQSYASIRSAGFALFSQLYGEQRKEARVSKVLHLKRPDFFPILDRRVLALYRPKLVSPPSNQLARVPLYWDLLRGDLLLPANQAALVSLRGWINAQVTGNAHFRDFMTLTDIRLFDIAACW